MLTWKKDCVSQPEVSYFQEFILQSLIRQWLSQDANLQALFNSLVLVNFRANDFEVLGERALPEGHIDILIKDCMPAGYNRKIIVEVKTGKAKSQDIIQLKHYLRLDQEYILGILIAQDFSEKVQQEAMDSGIKCIRYSLGQIDKSATYSLDELKLNFQLTLSGGR